MPATVAPLNATHRDALRALLAKDPAHNMYLLGLLEEHGLEPAGEGLSPFCYWGRFNPDLTAVVFVGGAGGLIVPSASPTLGINDIAKALVGQVSPSAVMGEVQLVEVLIKQLGGHLRVSKPQRLFSVSADDLGPFTNPLLRLATEADLPRLMTLEKGTAAELFRHELQPQDEEGFAERVRRRIRARRTYVLEENGRLVFKLSVGPRSQYGAELEGLYTLPEERNKGHATLCLGQISRFLMSSLPRLTVRVDDDSPHFAAIARKVGYLPGRAQRLVLAGGP